MADWIEVTGVTSKKYQDYAKECDKDGNNKLEGNEFTAFNARVLQGNLDKLDMAAKIGGKDEIFGKVDLKALGTNDTFLKIAVNYFKDEENKDEFLDMETSSQNDKSKTDDLVSSEDIDVYVNKKLGMKSSLTAQGIKDAFGKFLADVNEETISDLTARIGKDSDESILADIRKIRSAIGSAKGAGAASDKAAKAAGEKQEANEKAGAAASQESANKASAEVAKKEGGTDETWEKGDVNTQKDAVESLKTEYNELIAKYDSGDKKDSYLSLAELKQAYNETGTDTKVHKALGKILKDDMSGLSDFGKKLDNIIINDNDEIISNYDLNDAKFDKDGNLTTPSGGGIPPENMTNKAAVDVLKEQYKTLIANYDNANDGNKDGYLGLAELKKAYEGTDNAKLKGALKNLLKDDMSGLSDFGKKLDNIILGGDDNTIALVDLNRIEFNTNDSVKINSKSLALKVLKDKFNTYTNSYKRNGVERYEDTVSFASLNQVAKEQADAGDTELQEAVTFLLNSKDNASGNMLKTLDCCGEVDENGNIKAAPADFKFSRTDVDNLYKATQKEESQNVGKLQQKEAQRRQDKQNLLNKLKVQQDNRDNIKTIYDNFSNFNTDETDNVLNTKIIEGTYANFSDIQRVAESQALNKATPDDKLKKAYEYVVKTGIPNILRSKFTEVQLKQVFDTAEAAVKTVEKQLEAYDDV